MIKLRTFLVVLTVCLACGSVKAGTVGDVNNDGKIDLTEAIYALQIASGAYPNLDSSCQLIGKGDWGIETPYVACDVVSINTIYYVCTSAHTSSSDFLNDAANWQLLTIPGNWQKIGDDIHFMGGNVGIGTSTPESKLEVDGTIHSTNGGFKFPDETVQTTAASLQCYTGAMYYDNPTLPYCSDTPIIEISNPYPSSSNPNDVFYTFCVTPSPFDPDTDVLWGLRCKEGWLNTGCEGSMSGLDSEDGTTPYSNGCHMDEEEYDSSTIFTTCCRISPAI